MLRMGVNDGHNLIISIVFVKPESSMNLLFLLLLVAEVLQRQGFTFCGFAAPLLFDGLLYCGLRRWPSVPSNCNFLREVFLRGFFSSLGWSSPSRFLFGGFSAVAASSSCHVPWHTQQ